MNHMLEYDSDSGRYKPNGNFALEVLEEPEKIVPSYFEVPDLVRIFESREYFRENWQRAFNEASVRRYQQTEEFKKGRREYHKTRDGKEPHKRSARDFIRRAIQRGEIERPERCSMCGRKGIIHGHHPDYSCPEYVEWLCIRCHFKLHRESPWLTEMP